MFKRQLIAALAVCTILVSFGSGNNILAAAPNQGPVLDNVTGPVQMNKGESKSWTVDGYDPDGTRLIFRANWGDGTGETNSAQTGAPNGVILSATLSHIFNTPGTYTIIFTVVDDNSASAVQNWTVTVAGVNTNKAPVLDNITGPVQGKAGDSISWIVNGYDPDGTNLTFSTNWGDGSGNSSWVQTGTAVGQTLAVNETHTFAAAGTYTITFRVVDDQNATAEQQWTMVISAASNVKPVLDAVVGPVSISAGASTTWVVKGYDPDGTVLNYKAIWGDGSADSTNTKTSSTNGQLTEVNFSHAFASARTYTINFSITDVGGSAADQAWTVVVNSTGGGGGNIAPSVSLTNPTAGQSFSAPATISLQASASDSDGTVTKVEFFDSNNKLGESLTAPYVYTWTGVGAGAYVLTARATDNAGATTSSTIVGITVSSSGGGGCGSNCGGGGGGGGSGVPPSGPRADSVGITIVPGSVSPDYIATVELTYSDDVTTIALSNTSDFANALFEARSTTKRWQLIPGTGLKTVYARFRNSAGGFTDKSATIAIGESTNESPTPRVLGEACYNIVAADKASVKTINQSTVNKLRGRFVFAQGQAAEAWYVNTSSGLRYYLPSSHDAYGVLQLLATGISNDNINKIPLGLNKVIGDDTDKDGLPDAFEQAIGTNINKEDTDGDGYTDLLEVKQGYNPNGIGKPLVNKIFANRQLGKIFIAVQNHGELWYVNPKDGKRYLLPNGDELYGMLRGWSVGASLADLSHVGVGDRAGGVMLADQFVCGVPRVTPKLVAAKKVVARAKPRVAGVSTKKVIPPPVPSAPAICKIDPNEKIKQIEQLLNELKKNPSCVTK